MGKVKAETMALDYAIEKAMKDWSGINPELLPTEVRRHYNLKTNKLKISRLSLEEKMVVWGAISPKHKVFVYFSEDGVLVQDKKLSYFNDVPMSFTMAKEEELFKGVVVSEKNVYKYLKRMSVIFDSKSYNLFKLAKPNAMLHKAATLDEMEYVDFVQMFFFNYAYRVKKATQRYGITVNEFNLLLGCSMVDDFRINKYENAIYEILGVRLKLSNLYKVSNTLLAKGLIEKTRHSRQILLDSTPKGEDMIAKVTRELTKYKYEI